MIFCWRRRTRSLWKLGRLSSHMRIACNFLYGNIAKICGLALFSARPCHEKSLISQLRNSNYAYGWKSSWVCRFIELVTLLLLLLLLLLTTDERWCRLGIRGHYSGAGQSLWLCVSAVCLYVCHSFHLHVIIAKLPTKSGHIYQWRLIRLRGLFVERVVSL